jgi:hypothetical protein
VRNAILSRYPSLIYQLLALLLPAVARLSRGAVERDCSGTAVSVVYFVEAFVEEAAFGFIGKHPSGSAVAEVQLVGDFADGFPPGGAKRSDVRDAGVFEYGLPCRA